MAEQVSTLSTVCLTENFKTCKIFNWANSMLFQAWCLLLKIDNFWLLMACISRLIIMSIEDNKDITNDNITF